MINRKGVSGLIDLVKDANRKKLALMVGVPVALLIVVVVGFRMMSGGGESGAGSGDGSLGTVMTFDDQVSASGDSSVPGDTSGSGDGLQAQPPPGPSVDEQVAEQVAATMEAMAPTATPEPTPDLAATLEADLGRNRGSSAPAFAVNPLDSTQSRAPYLNQRELDYLSSLGEDVWIAVQSYFVLQDVMAEDFGTLSLSFLQEKLVLVNSLLAGLSRILQEPPRDMNEVVVGYVQFVQGGVSSIHGAAGDLRAAVAVVEGAEVDSFLELDQKALADFRRSYLGIERGILDFYGVMGSYGCSVCGELFRQDYEGR